MSYRVRVAPSSSRWLIPPEQGQVAITQIGTRGFALIGITIGSEPPPQCSLDIELAIGETTTVHNPGEGPQQLWLRNQGPSDVLLVGGLGEGIKTPEEAGWKRTEV